MNLRLPTSLGHYTCPTAHLAHRRPVWANTAATRVRLSVSAPPVGRRVSSGHGSASQAISRATSASLAAASCQCGGPYRQTDEDHDDRIANLDCGYLVWVRRRLEDNEEDDRVTGDPP